MTADSRAGVMAEPRGGDALLEVRRLSVRYGRFEALAQVSLRVPAGSVVGLIGPNGAGKTTLIDAVTGLVPLVSGSVSFGGVRVESLAPHLRARMGMARTFQALELFEDLTVEENLTVAAEACSARAATGPLSPEWIARVAGGLQDLGDMVPSRLSHPQRKQLALRRALASRPRVLLLDEPASGLDPAERRFLVAALRILASVGVGVLLVDHDTDLVFDVCDEVWALDFGRVIAHGPPGVVRADPDVRNAYLGPAVAPAALRAAPPVEPRPPAPPAAAPAVEHPSPGLEVENLSAGYGGAPVLHGVTLRVRCGEVVALLGPNGAGKTTTLRAISGAVPAMGGAVTVLGAPVGNRGRRGPPSEVAARVARRGLAHAPQDRGVMAGLTVRENLRLGARGRRDGVDEVLARFPRLEPLLGRRAGDLSGGEQQLLALARALAAGPRVLLVDEPSLGLGPAVVAEVLTSLRSLADDGNVAVLLVEQHVRLALGAADRTYVMAGGRVVLEGPSADLAARPEALEAAYLGRPLKG